MHELKMKILSKDYYINFNSLLVALSGFVGRGYSGLCLCIRYCCWYTCASSS